MNRESNRKNIENQEKHYVVTVCANFKRIEFSSHKNILKAK